jgi:histidinol phosphatase-like PHP family hydrolase
MARKHGAKLVIDTDAHSPGDLISREFARRVARGAGLSEAEAARLFKNAEEIVQKAIAARKIAGRPRKKG